MGRGRAKAKQQKVARDLKYNTHFTDLDALQRELGVSEPGGSAGGSGRANGSSVASDPAEDEDGYADSAGPNEDSGDDYESWTGTDR